jgi:hypothetical protein
MNFTAIWVVLTVAFAIGHGFGPAHLAICAVLAAPVAVLIREAEGLVAWLLLLLRS